MNITVFEPTFRTKDVKLDIPPEMLAAILARYSRKGEGLESILKVLEKTPVEKFEETVWSFLDYGHASIGGLTSGIPMAVDKVSMLFPYLTFFLQPKQDGQETSTRYVEFKPEGLAHPSLFGIPERFHEEWYKVMLEGFAINKELTEVLDQRVRKDVTLARIPKDASEKEQTRMIKNYGFDRARYTLPLAGLTNFGVIMTAREWAQTIQYLDSFSIPEFNVAAAEMRKKISEVTPRLVKHSLPRDRTSAFAQDFLDRGVAYLLKHGINTEQVADDVQVSVLQHPLSPYFRQGQTDEQLIEQGFKGKKNRYDFAKGQPEKVHISVTWNNISIAEARDFNRQRPCKKDTLLAPIGSYMPEASIEGMKEKGQLYDRYKRLLDARAQLMQSVLHSENPRAYVGCLLLGDQTPFEMQTTGDHFAYVTELRTGRGVHFRYDDHMRQAYEKVAQQNPALAKQIALGTGEPE